MFIANKTFLKQDMNYSHYYYLIIQLLD